ncbi:hypothetical protein BJX62DRAFT_144100 [Aspergillus germanicus]
MDSDGDLFDALVNFDYEYKVLLPDRNIVDILEERTTPPENAPAPKIALDLSGESPVELLEDPVEQLAVNTNPDTSKDALISPPPPTDYSFETDKAARDFIDEFTKQRRSPAYLHNHFNAEASIRILPSSQSYLRSSSRLFPISNCNRTDPTSTPPVLLHLRTTTNLESKSSECRT